LGKIVKGKQPATPQILFLSLALIATSPSEALDPAYITYDGPGDDTKLELLDGTGSNKYYILGSDSGNQPVRGLYPRTTSSTCNTVEVKNAVWTGADTYVFGTYRYNSFSGGDEPGKKMEISGNTVSIIDSNCTSGIVLGSSCRVNGSVGSTGWEYTASNNKVSS
jgi:hypothetical protein